MARARAVIGANFGDEGKGLFTDYLCATEGADVVVRFNGGAQAGHTVQEPGGQRYVFSHLGSGTLCEVPTLLAEHFVCNPILFEKEIRTHPNAVIYAQPECRVSTYLDMLINQEREIERGESRHGSCGVGFHETIERHKDIPITMADLWEGRSLEPQLAAICKRHLGRTGWKPHLMPEVVDAFMASCRKMAEKVQPGNITWFKDPIFEGAQGLLLGQNSLEFWPHLTPSYPGMRWVRQLCADAAIKHIEPYYVTRTYLTRHGAGPLPGEDPALRYHDDTNVEHEFQGPLRFAPLDWSTLFHRCARDAEGLYNLVITHCDQLMDQSKLVTWRAFGPRRIDIERPLPLDAKSHSIGLPPVSAG